MEDHLMTRILLLIAAAGILLSGCAVDLGKDARFGMYGGKQPDPRTEQPFDVQSTMWDTRWFPAYVRWAPDDSHLLVSLCHVNRHEYCRIGKYWLAEKRWELLDLQPRITYRWPSYAPDGKRIVATAGGCDENYVCPKRLYTLMLLDSDGKHPTKLANTYAEHPTFSDDGKKIIYWKLYGGGGADVAMFDLAAGKEQLLTRLIVWASDIKGNAYFLPGGQKFVFACWLPIHGTGELLRKDGQLVYKDGRAMTVPHPLHGTKLDPEGPNRGVMYVADMRHGIVTKENVTLMELLWPGEQGVPMDLSRSGEVMYLCGSDCFRRKLATGVYKANPVELDVRPTAMQRLLMLRPPNETAQDTAAFLLPSSAQIAAISNDSRRVAFSEANPDDWYYKRRFGIVSLDNAATMFIDWPRLELDPAATQPSVQ